MAANLTILIHKIDTAAPSGRELYHLPCSRRPVRKLFDTPSYTEEQMVPWVTLYTRCRPTKPLFELLITPPYGK